MNTTIPAPKGAGFCFARSVNRNEVELRVDVTINGVAYPTCSNIATCP